MINVNEDINYLLDIFINADKKLLELKNSLMKDNSYTLNDVLKKLENDSRSAAKIKKLKDKIVPIVNAYKYYEKGYDLGEITYFLSSYKKEYEEFIQYITNNLKNKILNDNYNSVKVENLTSIDEDKINGFKRNLKQVLDFNNYGYKFNDLSFNQITNLYNKFKKIYERKYFSKKETEIALLKKGFSYLNIDISEDEIFTSLTAARNLVEQKQVRPMLLVDDRALPDFKGQFHVLLPPSAGGMFGLIIP